MSDTPRTDEVLEMYFHARGTMLAKLAKELERELGDLISLLASEKSTRNHLIKRGAELERELDDLKSQRADFGVLVDKMDRELDAAKAMIESLEDALIEIEASLYEDESENAAGDACWHVARKALKKLKEHQ